MSSYLRTIEKRMMKKAGVKITTHVVPFTNSDGVEDEKIIRICGHADDETYGAYFPQRIPRKFVPAVRGNDYVARLKREARNAGGKIAKLVVLRDQINAALDA